MVSIPTSNHNQALSGDTLYSAFLNYEWREAVIPFIISGLAELASTIEDESDKQDFEVLYGALIDDLYDAENMDFTPVGNMMVIPHDTVPDKWLLCHGTVTLDRVDYPELYDLLTEFQIDADTFNLPNMSNTFVRGYSSIVEPVGTGGGAGTVTLNIGNIPPHTHTQQGRTGGGALLRNVADTTGTATTVNIQETASTPSGGGGPNSFAIIPPYIRMKYIIKALP